MATIATSSIQDNFTIPISGPVYFSLQRGLISSLGNDTVLNTPISVTSSMESAIPYNALSSYFREATTTDLTNLKINPILYGSVSSTGSSIVQNSPISTTVQVENAVPIQEVGFRTYNTFVGGSTYLSGNSGIYIQDPGTLYNLNASTNTIEFWMRPTKLPDYGSVIGLLSKRGDTSITPANWITLAITSAGLLQLQVSSTSISPGWALTLTGTKSISAGTWYHIVITNSSNNWTIYLNGQQYAFGSSTGTVRDTSNTLVIGAYDSTGSNAFSGYITGFRYVINTQVYTAPFTVPNYAPTSSASANQDANPSSAILIDNTDLLINPIYGTSTLTDTSNNSNTNITGTYSISALSPLETLYSTKINQNLTLGFTGIPEIDIYGLPSIQAAVTSVELWI